LSIPRRSCLLSLASGPSCDLMINFVQTKEELII
jgi:hypothetical protein